MVLSRLLHSAEPWQLIPKAVVEEAMERRVRARVVNCIVEGSLWRSSIVIGFECLGVWSLESEVGFETRDWISAEFVAWRLLRNGFEGGYGESFYIFEKNSS